MFAAGLLHSQPGDERQELVSTILESDSDLRNSSSKTLQLVFSRETGEFVDVVDSTASPN